MRVLGKRESKGTHDNANLIDENTKVKELDNKSFLCKIESKRKSQRRYNEHRKKWAFYYIEHIAWNWYLSLWHVAFYLFCGVWA